MQPCWKQLPACLQMQLQAAQAQLSKHLTPLASPVQASQQLLQPDVTTQQTEMLSVIATCKVSFWLCWPADTYDAALDSIPGS